MITQEKIAYNADEIKAMIRTCEKYNKARNMAKKIYYNSEFKPDEAAVLSKYLPMLFPELKESKDERIRKVIYGWIYTQPSEFFDNGFSKEEMLDWVEKQADKDKLIRELGEYKVKYTQKVLQEDLNKNTESQSQPKFKVGYWITDGRLTCKVLGVTGKSYELHLHNDDYCHFETDIQSVDKYYRLWAINDAKDGDVLVCEDENFTIPFIAIYKCLGDTVYNNKGLKDLTFNSHCFMGFNGNFYEGEGGHVIEGIHPGTKEQRDLLFQKMKEAGYEWDAQKKEVKKLTDEVEPRFKEGDFIMNNDITEHGKPEIFKIIKVCSSWYDVENVYDGRQTMITFSQEYTCHLWTIDDAKQGDILVVDNEYIVVLYRKITDGTGWKDTSILTEYQYDINDNTFTKGSHLFYYDICPATYTQREVLTNYIQQVLNWEK